MSDHVLTFVEQTTDIIKKIVQQEEETPVLPYQNPQYLLQNIAIKIQEDGLSKEAFFKLLEKVALATPSTASNGFFNQLYGGRSEAALSGDILSSLMNNSMYTYKVAGIQTLIEKEVLTLMSAFVGFNSGEGTLVSGGSISNLTAILIARNEKEATIRNEGFANQKLCIYTSEECHYSIQKSAGILGIGRNQVKKIPTDNMGKMNTLVLEECIKKDIQAGEVPFFINATAGTTVLGAFDPVLELSEIAQQYSCWLHIDGAFGGSVILSKKYKSLIKGSEKADSFAWNAHKMMNIPLTASAILFKQKGVLKRNLSEKADYLFQEDYEYNPGEESLQCGRRNDGLKIWSAWRYYGNKGYEKRIDKLFDLTSYTVEKIKHDKRLVLYQEPECTTVCFDVIDKDIISLCNELNRKGVLKVSYGIIKGNSFVRLVLINPDLNYSDIDLFFEKLFSLEN